MMVLHVLKASSFDWTMGNTTVMYSEIAYCGNFDTRSYTGLAKGFVLVTSFDVDDIVGFIGYNPNDKTIYISYRGSETISNWITNLDIVLSDCPSEWKSTVDGCEVHKGFLTAERSVYNDYILPTVQNLQQKYKYKVVTTGHSLGAALATITAIDLINDGIQDVSTFHFGSPRVGNEAFGEFISSYIPSIHRCTHHKDMVPHSPTHERFMHTSGEWYEDPDLSLKECSGYEDPTCSYQWHITSIEDHLHYLGQHMGINGCDEL